MPSAKSIHVGVAGAADCDVETCEIAENVGREIAQAGATLVCGGRLGVMEAAAKGARSLGGHTIGVLPGSSPQEANEYIETIICTGLGQARNMVFVLSTAVLIAVGGEYGTLSEIALALKHRIPVVGLNTWSIEGLEADPYFVATTTASEAVRHALELVSLYSTAPRTVSSND